MVFGWKMRVCIVLSAIWLCVVFTLANDGARLAATLGVGVMPLVALWGIAWAVAGWRAQRPPKDANAEALVAQRRAKLWARSRTAIAVVVIFALGQLAANWQFSQAGSEVGRGEIDRWFGAWMVYGIFAYAAFRAIPKLPMGVPLILTSLFVVGGVNWKAYEVIAVERNAQASLALAVPFLNRILSGTPVSDTEVREARIGVLEPLVLAQAAYSRDLTVIVDAYRTAVAGLQLEHIFVPAKVASPAVRQQIRATLKQWEQATVEFKSQTAASTARGKLGITAAAAQMPTNYAVTVEAGFDEAAVPLTALVSSLAATQLEASQAVTAILDLLDSDPTAYVLDKGPPSNLLFRDASTLVRYQRHYATLLDVSTREQQARDQFQQSLTSKTERLTALLKK